MSKFTPRKVQRDTRYLPESPHALDNLKALGPHGLNRKSVSVNLNVFAAFMSHIGPG